MPLPRVPSPRAKCFEAQVTATHRHCLKEEMSPHSSQLLKRTHKWLCAAGGILTTTTLPLVLSWTKKREPGRKADWAPSHNHDSITQL